MLFSGITEHDCDKRLAEFRFNTKEKYYKLINNTKFDSKLVSIDQIKQYFIRKNKENNNDFAYMVLNVNSVPPMAIPMPCRVCDYKK